MLACGCGGDDDLTGYQGDRTNLTKNHRLSQDAEARPSGRAFSVLGGSFLTVSSGDIISRRINMCRKSFIEESDGTRGTVRCESIGGDSSTKGRISHSEAEQWRRSLIQKVQQLEALPNRGRYDPKAPGQYHGYPELLCAKEGTYKVRFYVDSENELYRSVFIHQSSSLKIPCFDPSSCAICQNVKILNKKWKGVRRYSRKEICFAYVWIYRGIGKYARQSGTGLKMLWGFRRFADEIARILSGLELDRKSVV